MSKNKAQSMKQRGGNDDLSDIHFWSQDVVPPSSYKIQLGYVEIPKTVQLETKWVDTPYRFKSFHDANSEANLIFEGYQTRIIGSNDNPYWEQPAYAHQNRNMNDLKQDNRWFSTVGIQPSSDRDSLKDSRMTLPPERQYAVSQLSKQSNSVKPKSEIPKKTNQ